MARQRTTFGKIMRERDKQQRAQEKMERRNDRSPDTEVDDDEVATGPVHDQSEVLSSLEKLHKAFDDEQIDFDTFEERRAELMSRLTVE